MQVPVFFQANVSAAAKAIPDYIKNHTLSFGACYYYFCSQSALAVSKYINLTMSPYLYI